MSGLEQAWCDMTIRVVLPLQHRVRGHLTKYFYSQDGVLDRNNIWWITPVACFTPDGLSIGEFKTVPTLERYDILSPEIKFEVWDKLQRSKPILVATVYIDPRRDWYIIDVTERYRSKPNQIEFNLHTANREPDSSQAFLNKTPHGEWKFKDTL